MTKSRLEAFTDAIIAIIMTLLVLGLHEPEAPSFSALFSMHFQFFVYLLSFLTLAVYWSNHHHMFQAAKHVSGRVLWLNTILVLCMSLFPFTTEWVSHNFKERAPELAFAFVMLLVDVVWYFLARALAAENGAESVLTKSLNKVGYRKSYITIAIISVGIVVGVFVPLAALISCIASLVPWIIPDRDIEKRLRKR
jgi:uncharacterized membrane protein